MNDRTLITLRDISLAYGRRQVLTGFSAIVEPDDFIVVTGANGSGKTTLLRLLAGLFRPVEGEVMRRAGLVTGYLPQRRDIDRSFPVTVSQVVLSGLHCRKPWWKPFTAAHRRQAADTLAASGLSALAGRSVDRLSGGQWQRTLLARALVSRPHLLLLDEPDTHLDATSRDDLYRYLVEWSRQCAVVVVSHNADALPAVPGRREWRL